MDEDGELILTEEQKQLFTYIDDNDVKNVQRMLEEGVELPPQYGPNGIPLNQYGMSNFVSNVLYNPKILNLFLKDGRIVPERDDLREVVSLIHSYGIDDIYGHHRNLLLSLRLLLQDGRVDPTYDNNTLIIDEASEGHTQTVEILLEDPRVDPRANNHEALRKALLNNHREIVMLLLEWYGVNNVPINQIINLLTNEYRKYILMYYDLNKIPLDTYDFKLVDGDEEFVDYMLASLAYDTQRRNRFLQLINPVGYNLRGAGIPVLGVRDIISEYAGINPEVKTNYEISQTLDDIGIPPELTSLIGSLLIGQRRSDTVERRAGAGAGAEYPDSDSD
jgi:hypothetical protein